jgi:hypothetical protein
MLAKQWMPIHLIAAHPATFGDPFIKMKAQNRR